MRKLLNTIFSMKSFLFILILVIWLRRENLSQLQLKMNQIDTVIHEVLSCHRHIPGLSLAIIQGTESLTKGYGFTDFERNVAVNDETVFGMGSLTKSFTASLAIKVLHGHGLSVTSKLAEILRNDSLFADPYLSREVTVSDLFTHGLGLLSNNFYRYRSNFRRDDIKRLYALLKPRFPFRKSFVYSNMNYGYIGYITEQLENQTWEFLLHDKILKPAGMNQTYLRSKKPPKNLTVAVPYIAYENETRPMDQNFLRIYGLMGSSGSMMTSAKDAARWLYINLNRGLTPENATVLSEQDVLNLHEPRAFVHSNRTNFLLEPIMPVSLFADKYAAGWRVGSYRGHILILHTGTTLGYSAFITMLPHLKVGLYTSFNSHDLESYIRFGIHIYILDILLGENPWLDDTSVCTFPEPWYKFKVPNDLAEIDTSVKASRPLDLYVGLYGNPIFGNVSITLSKTKNRLLLKYNLLEAKLYPSKGDVFDYVGTGISKHIIGKNIRFLYNHTQQQITEVFLEGLQPNWPPKFVKY